MTARPVTQQGLAGAKINAHVGRQIQDAQYFYAKLSEKLSQVTEINESLQQEFLDIEKNSSKRIQMQSRLDELKDEVKTLEVHLRDHNLVLQRAAVQASAADVEDQIRVTNASFQPPYHGSDHVTTLCQNKQSISSRLQYLLKALCLVDRSCQLLTIHAQIWSQTHSSHIRLKARSEHQPMSNSTIFTAGGDPGFS